MIALSILDDTPIEPPEPDDCDDRIDDLLIDPDDHFCGTDEDDTITGTAGQFAGFGEGGDDVIRDGDPQTENTFSAFTTPPAIFTDIRDDILFGDSGDDDILANAGVDTVLGGFGQDTVTALGLGSDAFGEGDNDTVYANGRAYGGDGDDVVTGFEAQGGAGDDTLEFAPELETFLQFNSANNAIAIDQVQPGLYGESGDEVLLINETAPDNFSTRIYGGEGNDLVEMSEELRDQTDVANGFHVLGNSGDDTISMGAGNDVLDGGRGEDVIYAGAGDDNVNGIDPGLSRDTLDGGTCNDTISMDVNDQLLNAEEGDKVSIYLDGVGEEWLDDDVNLVTVHPSQVIELHFDSTFVPITTDSEITVEMRQITAEYGVATFDMYEVFVAGQATGITSDTAVTAENFVLVQDDPKVCYERLDAMGVSADDHFCGTD